uniref:Amine oxidase domain-containing protein n=1 Tax=Plectus sambesii TaxID=2011161 RepID=A0A914XM40_9BILA
MGAVYRLNDLISQGTINADDFNVVVLEKESEPGGLARSVTDANGFSWDLGVHITGASKYPYFIQAIEDAIDDWNLLRRSVQADMKHVFKTTEQDEQQRDGESDYVPYPVQQAIPYFPESLKEKCIQELGDVRSTQFETAPKNFAEFTSRAFGKTLQEIFIRPYNKKVWTIDLEDMNCTWVEGRVPLSNLNFLKSQSRKTRRELEEEERSKPATWFRYPAHTKGIGETWIKVAEKLPKHWFYYNRQVVRIDTDRKQVISKDVITAAETIHAYDCILSTIPITELGRLTQLAPTMDLKYSTVVLVGLGLRRPQSEWASDVRWVYFPSPELCFYRCTFLSNFSTHMTPDFDKYWSLLCEIGLRHDEQFDEEEILQKTIDGLISRNVFSSKEQVVDRWLCVLHYGYPIPTLTRDEELRKAHAQFEPKNIYSRGRFGGWKYEFANQDHSFAMGYEFIDRWLLQTPETVYNTGLQSQCQYLP